MADRPNIRAFFLSFFLTVFFSLTSFYLLTVGVEGECCALSHSHTHTHTQLDSSGRGIDPLQRTLPLKHKTAILVCLQSNNNYHDAHFIVLFNIINCFNICTVTLPLCIYDTNGHYCIYLLNTSMKIAATGRNM
jgi:hypothetical protein